MEKHMYNDRHTIAASEINKYVYCPYQWYYERLYGRAYIRKKYNERNRALHLQDSMTAHFNKGLRFHKRYLFWNRLRVVFKIVVLLVVAILVVYLYLKGF
jgi:CRISPR/Cas system-associated exonuclease Cas4 (RecB family)